MLIMKHDTQPRVAIALLWQAVRLKHLIVPSLVSIASMHSTFECVSRHKVAVHRSCHCMDGTGIYKEQLLGASHHKTAVRLAAHMSLYVLRSSDEAVELYHCQNCHFNLTVMRAFYIIFPH